MKRIITGLLALCICISLCGCSSKQNQTKANNNYAVSVPEASEQSNNNVIEFETPIVVAEDETLRVELVKFYQEYRCWNENGYPLTADSSTKGATLEKFVVFKFYNKCDQDLYIEMESVYLGSDGAYCLSLESSAKKPVAGKNVTGHYLVQTSEKETLASMDELYSLDGEFEVFYQGEDGVLRNRYELKFSIPNALNGETGSAYPVSETASIYYGKWQVTDVKIAGENSSDENDVPIEEILKGILDVLDDTYFVFAESGDCCYYTGNGTTLGKWNVTETGVTAGTNVWVAEGNQLVCERDGFLLYWEKVSDSQAFPET